MRLRIQTVSNVPIVRMSDGKAGLWERGFSLIELLVVVAIVAVLAGLLLPALARSKNRAQGVYCLGNGKQMIIALHQYSADHQDFLPPNPDDGAKNPGQNWVSGMMRDARDATNVVLLTDARFAKLAPYTGPAYQLYKCPADKSTSAIDGKRLPRVRSFAMNQAVGTLHNGRTPVNAPWLDNNHSHQRNMPFRTYGKTADMIDPAPSDLWVLLDEDEQSINDAGFAVGMKRPEWIDWPATYHNMAGGFAFADGHSEIHRWKDARTKLASKDVSRKSVPGSVDWEWISRHTSALYHR